MASGVPTQAPGALVTRKAVQERPLSLHYPQPRLVQRKPGDTIHLRNCLNPARAAWPFQLEGAGDDGGRVEISLNRPCGNQLAARLPDLSERDQRSIGGGQAELLEELPARGGERRLVRVIFALGDRPGARVTAGPERAAGMGEEHFERGSPPEQQETGAALNGHAIRIAETHCGVATAGTPLPDLRTLAGRPAHTNPRAVRANTLSAARSAVGSLGVQTVFETAGGAPGLLRLAGAWHARVMDDEVVSHAFSHGFRPDHTARLAAYWGEALGGPASYSASFGDETAVVRIHSGNGPHEEMDRRAVACFDQALVDVGLAGDDRLRELLHDYFAWATRTAMSRYHRSADDVPDGLRIPHWSWDGLIRESRPAER